jgi:hypothetical protein
MKKLSVGFVALLLFLGSAQAQRHSERLDRLSKILGDKIVAGMPGWSHRSIEPIEGSKSVIVEQWEASNVIVRVAVIEYDTEESAVAALKDSRDRLKAEEDNSAARKKHLRLIKGDLPELADGGFIWDARPSDAVAFRKKDLLMFVSVTGPREYNDTALSRLFAQRVADVLVTQ